ncbi:hypothetical protein HJC23_002154 [Cyclotella cryptica]|uniref:FAD dependent oxidoreductase domain-containing protein n=1 Tax=Cyclotella cryptica TaxID=29204 RepID=A0ABD3Q6S0_9STRA|eukprot:CCRYP_008169-RA/>CCRYP_008169-RA protein AED:0.10 eAED:0.10 QI:0/-1/0/1/-1/1/1/0/858
MTANRLLFFAAWLCSINNNGAALAFAPASSTASSYPPDPFSKTPPRSPLSPTSLSAHIHRDVLIIGSGLAGLSIAHRLASTSGRHVTVLERETPASQRSKTVAGSFAAAGMLAPQSERMAAGPLLDVCLDSREMYGAWVGDVERAAREACGNSLQGDCAKYLWDAQGIGERGRGGQSLEPWEVGFHSTGGFLAPAFAGDAVSTWAPQPHSGEAYWLDDIQIRELEPLLHPNVVGGWWFPEDASVDARRLTCTLRAACVGMGVHILSGEEYEVHSLEMSKGKCTGVHLASGRIYSANSVVVANGSWMKNLLPVPIVPHKGQSLALRMPSNSPPLLNRVLFAQDTYIVPKADGRIVIGATVEPGRFDGDVTPEGMLHCLSEATRLVPSLKDLPIEETWSGLRPTTPDKCPILGKTLFENVYVAGGYWRNGVLLAPKTGQLVGDLILNDGDSSKLSSNDAALLDAFAWDRFTKEGGGAVLAASARYASSLYPVHKRSSLGVSSSVGTELGFYEGASAAKGDRERDRQSMFGLKEKEEEVLERAAARGISDAGAFNFGQSESYNDEVTGEGDKSIGHHIEETLAATDADPDALTVGVAEYDSDITEEETQSSQTPANEDSPKPADLASDLPSIYEKIKANKAKAAQNLKMGQDTTEEKPDLPFRIYHVDKVTREVTMVPPYTSPGEFFQMKEEGKLSSTGRIEESVPVKAISDEAATKGNQETFDGYQTIREAFGEGTTEEETAEATRRARMRNRVKSSEIDESAIGAMPFDGSSRIKGKEKEVVNGSRAPSTMLLERKKEETTTSNGLAANEETNEETLDGYQAIQTANSATSREEELQRMRESRIRNRMKSSELDDLFDS